jgi:hypothetical protein
MAVNVDPKLLDAAVRGVLAALASGALGALGEATARRCGLCDPRCRAAVRGLVRRTDEIRDVAEAAGDHAEVVRGRV